MCRRSYDPGRHQYGTGVIAGEREPLGGARNAERYPIFQRLDLSVSRAGTWRGMQLVPYFSLVNAYNAKNVFVYLYKYSTDQPTRRAISQFPILPSAGVRVAF